MSELEGGMPAEGAAAAEAVGRALDAIDAKLTALLLFEDAQKKKQQSAHLSPLEVAQVHLALAYALGSLVFVLLRALGQPPQSHPVLKELARVRHYMKKLAAAATKSSSQQQQQQQQQRTLAVDGAAAARFVKHALSSAEDGDTAEQQQQQQPRQKRRNTAKGSN